MANWDTDYLPASLKELIDVIGLEATKSLVGAYGGTRLTVPLKMPNTHALVELLELRRPVRFRSTTPWNDLTYLTPAQPLKRFVTARCERSTTWVFPFVALRCVTT